MAKKKDDDKSEKKKNIINHDEEMRRLNRVAGQIDGIAKMLGNRRKLADVLVQFKAVRAALKGIEERVFLTFAEIAVEDIVAAEKRKEREAKLEELLDMYKAG